MSMMNCGELKSLLSKGEVVLLDVRTPQEFQSSHIDGARNLPLGSSEFNTFLRESGQGTGSSKRFVLMCRSGGRSKQACASFEASKIEVCELEGGISSWEGAGLPLIYGVKKGVSLERQVRIAAGCLVLLGYALSVILSPSFIFLSVFVGAGLVFAGITDTCAMGMLLLKMPWNRSSSCSKCCEAK